MLSRAGVSAPYVLCPHSMSCIEALYWAQQYPQEIAANIGLTRWIPGVSESDAIKYGTLTEKEKELYRAVFYRSTATTAMVNELAEIKTSAEIVEKGYDEATWKGFQRDYINSIPYGKLIELSCPHYVHDYEYSTMAGEMSAFIEGITD